MSDVVDLVAPASVARNLTTRSNDVPRDSTSSSTVVFTYVTRFSTSGSSRACNRATSMDSAVASTPTTSQPNLARGSHKRPVRPAVALISVHAEATSVRRAQQRSGAGQGRALTPAATHVKCVETIQPFGRVDVAFHGRDDKFETGGVELVQRFILAVWIPPATPWTFQWVPIGDGLLNIASRTTLRWSSQSD